MLVLNLETSGKTTSDISDALDRVKELVEQGYTSGSDGGDERRYHFNLSGEEELKADDDDDDEDKENE